MAFLSVDNLSKSDNELQAVKNISFTQHKGQQIAIAGETGSGKSTLLKMIAGLVQPTAGSIYFEDSLVAGPNDQLIPGHSGIGYLSQYFELLNNYRVHEVLEMASKIEPHEADLIFSVCQITHLLNRKTNQLSGGEKQRIALARVLLKSPRLLLLDEPYSNLDALHKRKIRGVIEQLCSQLGVTCILVSHDPRDLLSWADKILILKDGQLIQQGSPKHIYFQPADEYCAGLFGDYNCIDKAFLTTSIRNLPKDMPDKIFIRPEQLFVTNESSSALTGYITHIDFWGSFYKITVQAGNQQLFLETPFADFAKGDSIHLGIRFN